jgi:hypothetical protein
MVFLMAKKKESEEREFFPGESSPQEYEQPQSDSGEEAPPLPLKKIITGALIILVIIIVAVLVTNLLGQNPNGLFGPNGEPISSIITKSNGGVIENPGNKLTFQGNSNERKTVVIKSGLKISKDSNVSFVIKRNGVLKIIHSGEDFYIDENGNIHLSINPEDDLDLSEYYDENTGEFRFPADENIDFTIEVIIDDPNGDSIIIDIDSEFVFDEFTGEGCVQLSRSSVKEATHYGVLETPIKIRVACEDPLDLTSLVTWKSDRMGNLEVIIGNKYEHAITLTDTNAVLYHYPTEGEYDAKIIFTPFKEFAGKKAQYSVNFAMGNGTGKIDFDVALDNLEQCIKITPEQVIIPSNVDSSTFTIDASSCSSNAINFSLCDNDEGCSGGVEGGITLSDNSFILSPKGDAIRKVTVSRGEIAGAYGVPITARISGTEKTFIDEKLVIVQPTIGANLVPDKFVVSLMGQSATDSVTIRNNTLAENVPVQANICGLYTNSTGKSNTGNNYGTGTLDYGSTGTSWWLDLITNSERYAGTGKYPAAILNILEAVDNVRQTTQSTSSSKNWDIKNSYLTGPEVKDYTNTELTGVEGCVTKAQTLKDKFEAANQFAQGQMLSQIVSMITTVTTLVTDTATLVANVDSAVSSINANRGTISSVSSAISSTTGAMSSVRVFSYCPSVAKLLGTADTSLATANSSVQTANSSNEKASASMAEAQSTSTLAHQEVLEALSTLNNLYSLYKGFINLTTEVETINAQGALDHVKDAKTTMTTVVSEAQSALSNLKKALAAAAIDSFSSASSDDARAKQYLESAQQNFDTMTPLVSEVIDDLLAAQDDITIAIQKTEDETLSTITSMSSLITGLITSAGIAKTKATAIQESITTAQSSSTAAQEAITSAQSALSSAAADLSAIKGAGAADQAVCCNPPYCVAFCGCAGADGSAAASQAGTAQANASEVQSNLSNIQSQLSNLQSQIGKNIATIIQRINQINTAYTMLNTLMQMTNSYLQAFQEFDSQLTPTISKAYSSQSVLSTANDAIVPAIESAGWLSTQENYSSQASEYINNLVSLPGTFNKERLTGLIGSAISNGFINGAYLADNTGGVYSTEAPTGWSINASGQEKNYNVSLSNKESKNNFVVGLEGEKNQQSDLVQLNQKSSSILGLSETVGSKSTGVDSNSLHFAGDDWVEGCNNIVSMILPDFIINLSEEGKSVTVSNTDFSAQWIDSSAKVFDVWNEQEMNVAFANRGASKNGYALVEFSAFKHSHDNPTKTSSGFGPFNVPDSLKQTFTSKYHFKFNVAPRKGNNYTPVSNDCLYGLVRGKTGTDAAPKVLESWAWDSISGLNSSDRNANSSFKAKIGTGDSSEPFIDATQLSILLSKKLGAFSDFMDSAQLSCPINPAQLVFEKVLPKITDSTTGEIYNGVSRDDESSQTCYLPLTTRNYDGLPALVYFLEGNTYDSSTGGFTDVENVESIEDLINIVDFNANLIRDGYGWAFQNDFAYEYSRSALKAGLSFLDYDRGAKKYFQDSDYAYFSSPALVGAKKKSWAIPDAGKYHIRMAVDFDDTARLFDDGRPAAKIIFYLYLLEAVNNNYSPLYYLPVDGSVAVNANSVGYATGFSSAADDFPVYKTQGAAISPAQKNSLVKSTYTKISDFSLLNSLASLRGKLLDVTYAYDAKNFADSNSKIIFSPTTATPLLFELNGIEGAPTEFLYLVKKENMGVKTKTNCMLLVSGVGDCTNLAGKKLSEVFYKSPDENHGGYGVVLPTATDSGKTYLKTIAYAPIDTTYGIQQPTNGAIISVNGGTGSNNVILLDGFSGMPINDKLITSIADSMANIILGVEKKSVCVASLGSREVFYWPEDSLYTKKINNVGVFTKKEDNAKGNCVK